MRVGIVTPAWNMAPWIAATIRSVLAQTHTDWRMVVIDDGSTDATADLTSAFFDQRLTLLRQPNAGVSVARNRGLEALDPSVEAVLCLDADDCLAPDALARLVRTRPLHRQLAQALYEAVDQARHHVYVENPYFSDPRLLAKLTEARQRKLSGVDLKDEADMAALSAAPSAPQKNFLIGNWGQE